MLNKKFQNKGVSFSLPSIRIDKFTLDLLGQLNVVRKSGLTFALESADEELQRSINKNIDIENFIEMVIEVARRKWRTIKIYLMIGFTEDNREIDKINILIDRIIERLKKEGLYLQINLHISPLIKKPLTPLEMEPQIDFKIIENKLALLRNLFYKKKYKRWIKLKGQDIQFSFLDAVLARSDRKMSKVLYTLLKKDYNYDANENDFEIDTWLKAFKENNIDYRDYIYNKFKEPVWKKFGLNYNDGFFEKEYEKYLKKEETPDCLNNKCYDCGICGKEIKNINTKTIKKENINKLRSIISSNKYQYELVFRKRGLFKYISHRDLLNVFEKIFRMINLPIIYSQGFNKRMKISMIFTPPLMVEGENEILLFSTRQLIDENKITEKANLILDNKDFKIKKIINISNNKTPLNSILKYSEYLIKFKKESFFRDVLKNVKEYSEITQAEELCIKLILSRDSSVTKFLQVLCNDEFPSLWNEIDWILRKRIY